MNEFKLGDTVLVPMKIADEESGIYKLQYKGASFWSCAEALKDFAQDKTYDDGLNDAWEVVIKVLCHENKGGLPTDDIVNIFGTASLLKIANEMSVKDAIAKIKAWEDEREIRVGDVVTINITGEKGVVIRIDNECYSILYEDGSIYIQERTGLEKTGRHIDIAGLLAEIGGN